MNLNKKYGFGFIQIPILIAIIVGVILVSGAGYVGVKQFQKSTQSIIPSKISTTNEQSSDTAASPSVLNEVEKLRQEIEELKKQGKDTKLPIAQVSPSNNQGSSVIQKNLDKPASSVNQFYITPSGAMLDSSGNVLSTPNSSVTNSQTVANTQLTTEQIAEIVSPSVVLLSTAESTGSGFVVNVGVGRFVITNAHVVGKNSQIKIHLHDGTEFDGTVLGRDEVVDLAIISTNGHSAPYLSIGSSKSADLQIGTPVYAFGFPFGLSSITLTTGILSSRQIIDGMPMLQTDAAINSGNSGGPLVNSSGEVVGVNSSKIKPSLGSGVAFAIPSETVKELIPDLLQGSQRNEFIIPTTGSTIEIPRSIVAQMALNPNLACEQLVTTNNLVLCSLYRNSYNDYSWIINENE